MRFNTKNALVAASLALAFGTFGGAHAADAIVFDPDGAEAPNGDTTVGSFDWTVSSALANNALASPSNFELYFHAALGGLTGTSGALPAPDGLNGTFEITVIGGFHESLTITSTTPPALVSSGGDGIGGGNDVYTVTQNGNLSLAAGATNFITMYYDDLTDLSGTQSDSLTGLGFNDGIAILSAIVTAATGTISVTQQFIDVDNSTTFTLGDIPLGVNLDNYLGSDWGTALVPILTAIANGSTSLTADIVGTPDADFFKTALAQFIQDLDFTTEIKLPFAQTNPSKSFDTTGLPLTLAGGGINVGTINSGFLGGAGPDIMLQADASNSFTRASVPEPGVLALLGLGFMGLALSRRKGHKFSH